ncbi:MAG TPA: hypothetical protein VIQ31_03905 [Phormidium sp.]
MVTNSNYVLSIETKVTKKQSTSTIKNLLAHSAKLGCILVNKKIISQSQLESTLNLKFSKNKKLGELLVEQYRSFFPLCDCPRSVYQIPQER